MEHRWGRRWPLEVAVMIDLGRGILERGLILNVSASGLLVRMPTGPELAPHTPVTVLYVERNHGQHQVHRIEAAVVRHSSTGTGLAYPDFNPPECAALLHLAGDVGPIPPAARQMWEAGVDPTCPADTDTRGVRRQPSSSA